MNEQAKFMFLHTQVTCAMIEVAGMQAANKQHQKDQPYGEDDFRQLIDKYGLGHNAVLEYLHSC